MPSTTVKALLERAYQEFHQQFYAPKDAIFFVNQYPDNKDREVVALISALLAYGNVGIILGTIKQILAELGSSPYDTLSQPYQFGRFEKIQHRWTNWEDLNLIGYWISQILRNFGSIENFFLATQSNNTPMKQLLSSFSKRIFEIPVPSGRWRITAQKRTRSLRYLLADPIRGSACKRINLFLRWMVRKNDGIDFGIWTAIAPKSLCLPVDTHLLKVVRELGWTKSKTATWNVVETATQQLAHYCPQDPVRYDFSLCHLSMEGHSLLEKYLDEKKMEQ